MTWPLPTDFNEALQHPATAFADPDLRRGTAVTTPAGQLLPRSGNFADVYQVRGPDGKDWGVKCFTRPVPDLAARYAAVDRALARAGLPFGVGFTYLPDGVRVNGRWWPAVKMEWVDGLLLNQVVRENAGKPAVLAALLQMWVKLCRRLRDAGIAHADLQHGNVILVPGSKPGTFALKLIDYDGVYVPELAGKPSGEVGHPNYQHPARAAAGDYSADLDRFPHLVVGTALAALAELGPPLWEKYDTGDNLLFTDADFRDPTASPLIRQLRTDGGLGVRTLAGRLALACQKPLAATPWLDEVAPDGTPGPLDQPTVLEVAALFRTSGPQPAPAPRPAPAAVEVLSLDDDPAETAVASRTVTDLPAPRKSKPAVPKPAPRPAAAPAVRKRNPRPVVIGVAAGLCLLVLGVAGVNIAGYVAKKRQPPETVWVDEPAAAQPVATAPPPVEPDPMPGPGVPGGESATPAQMPMPKPGGESATPAQVGTAEPPKKPDPPRGDVPDPKAEEPKPKAEPEPEPDDPGPPLPPAPPIPAAPDAAAISIKHRWAAQYYDADSVCCLQFSVHGRTLISNEHGPVKHYDVSASKPGPAFQLDPDVRLTRGNVHLVPYSPGRVWGLVFETNTTHRLTVWDPATRMVVAAVPAPVSMVNGGGVLLALTPTGRFVCVGESPPAPRQPARLVVYDTTTGRERVSIPCEASAINRFNQPRPGGEFEPRKPPQPAEECEQGEGCESQQPKARPPADQFVPTTEGWGHAGCSAHFTHDASRVLFVDRRGRGRWYALPSGDPAGKELFFECPGPEDGRPFVHSISWDGRVLMGPGAALFDAQTGRVLVAPPPPTAGNTRRPAVPVGVSADGRLAVWVRTERLVTADGEVVNKTGLLTVFDVAAGRVIAQERIGGADLRPVCALSPDGRFAAVYCSNTLKYLNLYSLSNDPFPPK